ncbi:MAG: hypothetical protein ACSHX6_11035 [Akkermansiaceae bacterium]
MDEYDRRHFIKTSIPGFLGISMALPAITAFATRANAFEGRLKADGSINWDAFLSAIEVEAGKQHLDSWNEVEYVKQAAAIAARLDLKDPNLEKAFRMTKERGVGNGRVDFSKLEKQVDYHVTLVQFEKGEEILHHDHPEMTGVLLCATGEVEVWNYDLFAEKANKKDVLLKQTSHAMLAKGKVSTLTSKERNIHRVAAREFTQLVDIFAPPYDKERIQNSNWYNVDPEGYKGKTDGLFEATRR